MLDLKVVKIDLKIITSLNYFGSVTHSVEEYFTLSLICLQGMSSSGEFSVSPHDGHAFVSESMRASRAHSSHIGQAQAGIMIASRSNSLQTGHF
jgi:hypothetical protein